MATELLQRVQIDPADTPRATVIWLHGLGADGHDFEPIVPQLRLPSSLPVKFVFPHAPRRPVTINYGMVMRAWFDILDMTTPRKVDMASFLESADALRRLIQHEIDGGMPSDRIVLAGFSQGGAIALHTGLRYPQPLAGIMGLSTYLPTLDALDQEAHRTNRAIPIFMAHGKHDPMIPLAYADETQRRLHQHGYALRWQTYPMQHAVCPAEIDAIREWLLTVLQPGA